MPGHWASQRVWHSAPTLAAAETVERRVPAGVLRSVGPYQIDSDCDVAEVAALARTLTIMLADYRRRFGAIADLSQPLTVRLFANHADYLAYGNRYCSNFDERWQGYYLYANRADKRELILFYRDDDSHLATALHEGVHQVLHTAIGDLSRQPQWFNEGIAELFERAEVDHQRQRLRLPRELSSQWRETLVRGITRQTFIPLSTLFERRLSAWNGDERDLNYAQAYAFIHFLASDHRPGQRALATLLRRLAEGQAYQRAFEASFGQLDLIQLEADWHRWLANRLADDLPAVGSGNSGR